MTRQSFSGLLASLAVLVAFCGAVSVRAAETPRDFTQTIDAEVAARAINMPAQMDLDLEWYSPNINASVKRAWVVKDLVLCETDKHSLVAIRKTDGYERWRCELTGEIRYAPTVSENNVVVNVANYLIGIDKAGGDIRWRLLPNFVMSSGPLVVDPATYPKEYTRKWENMETIYAGSWEGRFHAMTVRGRLSYFVQHQLASDNFAAPEFDLIYPWHKTSITRGSITQQATLRDNLLYYSGEDRNVYAVTRDAEEREPYQLLDTPSTPPTVTPSTTTQAGSVYIGAQNGYMYCLDRLTMKKKWSYPSGYPIVGTIFADEPHNAYVATENGVVHALEITPARQSRGQLESPETFDVAWETPGAGTIAAGPEVVYIGLKHTDGYPGYNGMAAVDKATGKTLWKADSGFFSVFLEYQHTLNRPDNECRIFALTTDNRVVCLKERTRNTGVRVFKAEKPAIDPSAPVKLVGGKKAGDADKKDDAAAPADKKDDAPKN